MKKSLLIALALLPLIAAAQTTPGGGFQTEAIELPRAWDTLMKELGYRPLCEFYISK